MSSLDTRLFLFRRSIGFQVQFLLGFQDIIVDVLLTMSFTPSSHCWKREPKPGISRNRSPPRVCKASPASVKLLLEHETKIDLLIIWVLLENCISLYIGRQHYKNSPICCLRTDVLRATIQAVHGCGWGAREMVCGNTG